MPAVSHRGRQEGCWLLRGTGYLAGFLQLKDSVLPETETPADKDTGTGRPAAWPPREARPKSGQIVIKDNKHLLISRLTRMHLRGALRVR